MIFNSVGGGSVRTPIITITSETELPADPKPGTIAILTTTPIGRIYAQTSTPESPSVGDLWFSPSVVANVVYIDGKEAYAVKTVRQYNGTAWETVNAFQYTDGAWSTMVYLLNGIDECKPVTGGWKAIAIRRDSGWTESEKLAPTITKVDGGIRVSQSASGYNCGAYHTVNKIDVSGYDVLRIQGGVTAMRAAEIRLVSAIGPYTGSNTVIYKSLPSSGAIDLTLDVSALDGDYYVLFDTSTDNEKATIFTLTKIWLSKVKYLFNAGDQCESVTGGWKQVAYSGYSNGGFSKEGTYIHLSSDSNGQASVATHVNAVDVAKFETLTVNFTEVTLAGSAACYIAVGTAIGALEASKKVTSTGKNTLDISSVYGKCFVFVYATRPSGDYGIKFDNVNMT